MRQLRLIAPRARRGLWSAAAIAAAATLAAGLGASPAGADTSAYR